MGKPIGILLVDVVCHSYGVIKFNDIIMGELKIEWNDGNSLDKLPMNEIIDRDPSEVTKRIIPYFEPDIQESKPKGFLKKALLSLQKRDGQK